MILVYDTPHYNQPTGVVHRTRTKNEETDQLLYACVRAEKYKGPNANGFGVSTRRQDQWRLALAHLLVSPVDCST